MAKKKIAQEILDEAAAALDALEQPVEEMAKEAAVVINQVVNQVAQVPEDLITFTKEEFTELMKKLNSVFNHSDPWDMKARLNEALIMLRNKR